MRLLRLEHNGDFSLAEYVGKNLPRYAILSHTWGEDHEEVTFRDLTEGAGKSKAGYYKLTFCAKQAAHDGLEFFWVDTCCIDKSSSAELSEAITSMFQWYSMAEKCYVYLSDVSIGSCVGKDLSFKHNWRLAFQFSKWFTRGWTLQELLAPLSVEFFSAEGKRLGGKDSLEREINNITGISVQALRGTPLSEFSIGERMSWAERRKTKREEDAAYALLGIFGISMVSNYGEGQKRAFVRLRREIQKTLNDEPHDPPTALSLQPPKRRRGDDGESQSVQHNLVCFKCGELGHYANDPHCFKCGEYGHLANELHCYKCNEYGHYADEPHCYRCNSRDHIASNCLM
ncbi:HET-domain-containing protein [Plenodomus tracheiphilus IPT5]|uniref:HET-domain-containing protein n=1 Tax=Plenodomus tracheiphilus IPT5 TaxID=1408161 RepID=A0A6A7ARG4_9PLEO|nr:HET-domain-containing protein [Plenodomus tracheiphilus IPT5]